MAPEVGRTPPALRGGYVRLKHTLSAVALEVTTHPRRGRTAAALLAYAGRSRDGSAVPVAALAAETGMPRRSVGRILTRTGLFADAAGGEALALAARFRSEAAYFYRQIVRLGAARRLLEGRRPRGVPGEIWRGAALFNAGLFFECHEYLEDIWREAEEPDRTFYHGLVQAAAGCYHLEKGNRHGAQTLIGKAIGKLRPFGPAHRGLDVAALVGSLRGVLAGIEAGPLRPSPGRDGLPVMRFAAPRRPRAGTVPVSGKSAAQT